MLSSFFTRTFTITILPHLLSHQKKEVSIRKFRSNLFRLITRQLTYMKIYFVCFNASKYIANERYKKWVHFPNGTIITAHWTNTIKWIRYIHKLLSIMLRSINNLTINAVSPIRNSQITNSQSEGWECLFTSLFFLMRPLTKSKVTTKTTVLWTYPVRRSLHQRSRLGEVCNFDFAK